MRVALVILSLGLLLTACDGEGGDDAGGAGVDAGPGVDASAAVDGGPGVDGGDVVDAGVEADGGGGAPAGGDTDQPFPIDRGDDPGTPGSYRGLPLRLVDNGEPAVTAVDGVIGVVCVGMSNATQECSHYINALGGPLAGEVNAEVVVVDCAVGGHAIERWNDPSFDARLWQACIDTKIPAAGIRPDQVRVLYHKAANQLGMSATFYPDPSSDYFAFLDNLGTFAGRVPGFFPSVTAVYTTSRSYGGFTDRPERGEPRSYEEGHALNAWLQDNASVSGVWYGWGPYIWAPDCASGETNGSGVCYDRADYQADGVHPAMGARRKITMMIHARFAAHAWYRP